MSDRGFQKAAASVKYPQKQGPIPQMISTAANTIHRLLRLRQPFPTRSPGPRPDEAWRARMPVPPEGAPPHKGFIARGQPDDCWMVVICEILSCREMSGRALSPQRRIAMTPPLPAKTVQSRMCLGRSIHSTSRLAGSMDLIFR